MHPIPRRRPTPARPDAVDIAQLVVLGLLAFSVLLIACVLLEIVTDLVFG